MSDIEIKPAHLSRTAVVYVRQSAPHQVEHNRVSTQHQYALVERALALGWSSEQNIVLDDDQAHTAATTADRGAFAHLTAEVAFGHVGIA